MLTLVVYLIAFKSVYSSELNCNQGNARLSSISYVLRIYNIDYNLCTLY